MQELCHRLRARMDVQFFVNAADVSAHRVEADAELVANFLDEKSLREIVQHFAFALRKVLRPRLAAGAP